MNNAENGICLLLLSLIVLAVIGITIYSSFQIRKTNAEEEINVTDNVRPEQIISVCGKW